MMGDRDDELAALIRAAELYGDAGQIIQAIGVPAERFRAPRVRVDVVAEHRLAPLPDPVDVQHADEVVQPAVGCERHPFPHGAFGDFAVTQQDERVVWELVDILGVQSQAEANGQRLAERASRSIRVRERQRGMTFEWMPELSKTQYAS